MWRCKEKLRDSEIVVTEDSQSRLMALMNAEAEKIKKEESLKRTASLSPKKKRGGSQSPTKVPTSPVKKSKVALWRNFYFTESQFKNYQKI